MQHYSGRTTSRFKFKVQLSSVHKPCFKSQPTFIEAASAKAEGHSKGRLHMAIYCQVLDASQEFSRLHCMNIITGGLNQSFS
jgi:hypothetical protein